jgi:signal transduction histidine kinase
VKVKNRFLINYIIVFFITSLIAVFVLNLLGVISSRMEGSLIKNKYTAYQLMQDELSNIEYDKVLRHNGGIQVVNQDYQVVLSHGINCFERKQLTASEFTDFLMQSQAVGREFSYSIAYNEKQKFWLIVTFPTSVRIDFGIAHNSRYTSSDTGFVLRTIIIIGIAYFLMLIISTIIFSRLSASAITVPLGRLKASAYRLSEGDYSSRAIIKSRNELGDIANTFNLMAARIQEEMELRKQSENLRRQLTLDITHDLKNPLAVIMGYAEYCIKHPQQNQEANLNIIYQKSIRANELLERLFELTRLESPDYQLTLTENDLCEYLRLKCASIVPRLEREGFLYEFDIPEKELNTCFDAKEMDRVLDNLIENALRYNKSGTLLKVGLAEKGEVLELIISDNGVGISSSYSDRIFEPFVRTDESRNSESGGSGLGLAIVKRIIRMHKWEISLTSDLGKGCTFTISIPKEEYN